MKINNNLQDARKLLRKVKALPPRAYEKTFLQIAGYAHYELVCSNLLKFFFDPNAAHGLGYLFLEALLRDEGRQLSQVRVQREVPTESRAKIEPKIDLVIYSETHLIGIENKIYASPNNPFDKYSEFLNLEANRNKIGKIDKFLLTKRSIHGGGNLAGFEPLTYDVFLRRIRLLRGKYDGQVDDRYKLFLTDFVNTMERLQPGVSSMTPEEVKFFAEADTAVGKLLALANEFREELRGKVLELVEALIDMKRYPNVKQRPSRKDEVLCDTLVHEIDIGEDSSVCVDATVSATGWDICVYPYRPGKEPSTAAINTLLDRFDIAHKNGELVRSHFDYDESLERVSRRVQEIVDKFAKPASRKARVR